MTNKKDFQFLFISMGMTLGGFALLLLYRSPMLEEATIANFLYVPWLILEFLIAFFLVFTILKLKNRRYAWLFQCAFFLANFGTLIVSRVEPSLTIPQIRWIIVGMFLCFIVFRFQRLILRLLNYKIFWGILSLSLFIITFLFGQEINGMLNCIAVYGVRIQPLELLKIVFIFFLASYMGNDSKTNNFNESKELNSKLKKSYFYILTFTILLFSAVLFIYTKDFGNAFIFFVVTAIITSIKIDDKLYIFLSTVCFILCMIICCYFFPDVKHFFDVWLNPWSNSDYVSKQIMESFFSFGAGGIWGTGFTKGYPDFIIDAHTYFVFSAVAEEFGLIGTFSLIMIYVVFFYQSASITFNLNKNAEIFLAYGIAVLFFLQTFTTILSVTNVLPFMRGVLPFMSYGSGVMTANFIMLGILISLSRKENFNG